VRRRVAIGALGLGALAVTAIVVAAASGGDEPGNARATAAGGSTATVERRTLVQRETVDGTLGYAGERTVINRLDASSGGGGDDSAPQGGQPESDGRSPQGDSPEGDDSSGDDSEPSYDGSGTVTSLPRAGSVVTRGQALYRLDGDPIVLMYGSTPAYRALESGVSVGPDVQELEQNLAALGFDPGTIDDTFDSSTAAAIGDWQESLDLDETGAIELGRVVFLPGPRRIGEHKTTVGSVLGAGSEVLDTSSTKRVVSLELEAELQDLAHEGERVEVELPGGGFARGRITKVGRVAREVEGDSADPNAEPQLVIDVTIELRRKRGLGKLDETPVSVGLAQETRRDVLAVPVTALVARQGGGYGLELAGNRRIVPVEAGLFADGYVEVSGGAIREGTRVVVPGE
jgi:peptidoglycan hydrolase-like protein with peptidoglycan-binding domain